MRSHRQLLTALLLFLLLLPTAAAAADLLDLQELPQDVTAYLAVDEEARALPLVADQRALAADYLARYFAPWEGSDWVRPRADAFWIIPWLKSNQAFAENRQPLSPSWVEELIALAAVDAYPSIDLRGITVRAADIRTIPTRRPAFRDNDLPGEGFPFDYFQNSAIAPNTPLRLRHRSPDGAWYYVEAPGLFGWLPAEDVALVNDAVARRFRAAGMVALQRDGVTVRDSGGTFRFTGHIGTLLPLAEATSEGYAVWIAVADADRQAVLRKAKLPAGSALPFPLPATLGQVAATANRMVGQPYGWGGLYGNRDCSAMIRDLFAPFGLWLPRNSARQAEAGRVIALDAASPVEKERSILRDGRPLRTLVWMNGHVMLYLGEYRGRAAVLHAFWGVRTRTPEGMEGRKVVGRTVITTLQPGLELADLARPEGDLLHRVRGMTLLDFSPRLAKENSTPGGGREVASRRQ